MPVHVQDLILPQISAAHNFRLEALPTPVEIRTVVANMGNFKSPGPDGMTW